MVKKKVHTENKYLATNNNYKKYDNLIMSWSCFGDFILVSQSMKTLVEWSYKKRSNHNSSKRIKIFA
jgi:hypothetical protein